MPAPSRENMERWEKIYHTFFPIVYNYIFYRTLSRGKTEAVVSRIFREALENLAQMKDLLSAQLYFRAAVQRSLEQKDEIVSAGPVLRRLDETDEEAKGRQAVLAALEQMPEAQRMLVLQQYCPGSRLLTKECEQADHGLEQIRPMLEAALQKRER